MESHRGKLVQHGPTDPGSLGTQEAPDTHFATHFAGDDDFAREPPPVSVGQDERRMQVRAYNYWASLLGDRPFPQIDDLTCAALPDFADHAVVLDYSQGVANPAVMMLGKKLAEECGSPDSITRLSDVPRQSLLSRITDRYMQMLASEAPIGFAAEFVNQRGTTLLYRGILLPFSADGQHITYIMGVINWKELADQIVTAGLRHELEIAVETAPAFVAGPHLPTWADGPLAAEPGELDADLTAWRSADWLAMAGEAAAAASRAEEHSRTVLYAALGRAWDLALAAQADPWAWREIAVVAGLAEQPGASLASVIKLVFGARYDKSRLAEFALALAHARRRGLGRGRLPEFLAGTPGGLKRVARAERRSRRTEAGWNKQSEQISAARDRACDIKQPD